MMHREWREEKTANGVKKENREQKDSESESRIRVEERDIRGMRNRGRRQTE